MKRFNFIFLVFSIFSVTPTFAHDGGHGPKVSDPAQHGGMVMPVIEKKDADKGTSAALVYKAELVRKEDGTFSVYFYDAAMKPLPTEKFGKEASAKIGPMKKNPRWRSELAKVALKDGAYTGILPKIKVKPYYMDVTVNEGARELMVAFENLD